MSRTFFLALLPAGICALTAPAVLGGDERGQLAIAQKPADLKALEDRVRSVEKEVVILKKHMQDLARAFGAPAVERPRTQTEIKVFQLVYADAASAAKIVSDLLPAIQQKTVRIAFDKRTNTVWANGPKQDLAIVEALLLRLDSGKGEKVKSGR